MGGVVVVESVFQFPGLGSTLAGAVAARDLPTVEAIALLVAGAYVCINLFADIIALALNPRLRRAQ
jgi:peptide/nickel transport system permease protein